MAIERDGDIKFIYTDTNIDIDNVRSILGIPSGDTERFSKYRETYGDGEALRVLSFLRRNGGLSDKEISKLWKEGLSLTVRVSKKEIGEEKFPDSLPKIERYDCPNHSGWKYMRLLEVDEKGKTALYMCAHTTHWGGEWADQNGTRTPRQKRRG